MAFQKFFLLSEIAVQLCNAQDDQVAEYLLRKFKVRSPNPVF